MSETTNPDLELINKKCKEPWLFDDSLTDAERMYWKLKGVCHVCKYPVAYHKDDCPFSDVQLHFAQIDKELYAVTDIGFVNSKKLKQLLNKK